MNIIEFLGNYWGIVTAVVSVSIYVAVNYKNARELALEFVLEAEEHARDYVLETLEDKKQWVYNWYYYLPKNIKRIVSFKAWQSMVDYFYGRYYDIK